MTVLSDLGLALHAGTRAPVQHLVGPRDHSMAGQMKRT
jgi:hypothetical protein